MTTNQPTPIDFSDLRLDAIEILTEPTARVAQDFAASCGGVCNARTACSCTSPKRV